MWAEVDAEIRALAAASGAVSAMMLSWEFDAKEDEEEEEEEQAEEEKGGARGSSRELSAGGAR